MPEFKLGELLIQNKLITKEQFDQALEMQQLTPHQPIGQILCMLGFLNIKDLGYILDHNKKRRKLGDILVSQGLIDEEKLRNALSVSGEEKIPLGRALIRQQVIEEEQVAQAIAFQHDLKFVSLSGVRLDPELSRFVNATFAQRLRIVPIRCRDNCLTIAMAYPVQRDELAQLESWCHMKIVPVIAKESDIIIAQQKIFKIIGGTEHAKLNFELSEDQVRDANKSKYVNDFISADVDYLVKRIIATGIKEGASDIHFESTENGMVIRYRLDGILQTVGLGADDLLISTNARQVVSKIKILCDMDIAERRRPQDSSFKMKVSKEGNVRSVDFRVSTVPTQFGENVVIRILDKRRGAITLKGLGYSPEDVKALYGALEKPTGIFLVTGPTGSGKSSTLYAILSHINTPGAKTLTIEDPIEYSIDGMTQTEVNENIGNTFARLLRAFLRQDPDNIMVGEIRDLETATIAMRAALTGHTVLSTLHTNDATSAVTRLIDMGVEPSLISTTLRCVLAQRLVRYICPDCKTPYLPPAELLQEFGVSLEADIKFFKGKGCGKCHYTGYAGRRPIVELWIPNREELLMFNRRPDNISLRNAVFSGVRPLTMIEDGFRRVLAGETTLEELMRTVPYEQIEAGREKIKRMLASAEIKTET
ncbi:type IV pilus assembly protein PilB [Trichlorobacter thiogenes]|uniref:Type IV pilus assembly protein PilB n=1 Tax=Trichlorobacter thiogenes TaxID=115783 RepID=A0A1T4NY95_9BACT|nr:GspE/PulE family protein [Trichlorobacter thiogenes]SJZ84181.1 type IV pilus assembly protein PilB [Trichlorobacter thiogenes]